MVTQLSREVSCRKVRIDYRLGKKGHVEQDTVEQSIVKV